MMQAEKGNPRQGRLVEEEEGVGEGEASEDSSGVNQELAYEVQVWVWARGIPWLGVWLAWHD